jgi:uncharacterized membrane protein YgdD (TMEM256/DUF423 family)
MHRKVLLWGLLFAAFSVVFGAFGAHALKDLVPAEKVAIFETGVRYQFLHALALILLSIFLQINPTIASQNKGIKWVAGFFIIGVFCFSGSLYLLTFQPLCSFPFAKWVGPITPLGGLFFMLGWANWIRMVWLHKVDK